MNVIICKDVMNLNHHNITSISTVYRRKVLVRNSQIPRLTMYGICVKKNMRCGVSNRVVLSHNATGTIYNRTWYDDSLMSRFFQNPLEIYQSTSEPIHQPDYPHHCRVLHYQKPTLYLVEPLQTPYTVP